MYKSSQSLQSSSDYALVERGISGLVSPKLSVQTAWPFGQTSLLQICQTALCLLFCSDFTAGTLPILNVEGERGWEREKKWRKHVTKKTINTIRKGYLRSLCSTHTYKHNFISLWASPRYLSLNIVLRSHVPRGLWRD